MATAVNVLPATSTDKPTAPAPSTRSRRFGLLLVALLVVTVINAARIVRFQEYFQLQLGEELSAAADPQKCKKLENSHVDPAFQRDDACYTQTEVLSIIKELVFTLADTFDAHNVTYFLDSGTLLGAFRNKGVIPHDNDADVGIDAAGLHYLQHNPVQFPPGYSFTMWNSSLYPGSSRDDKLPARLIHNASGLYTDVFAFLDWTDPETGTAQVGPLPSICYSNCHGCPKVKDNGKMLRVARDWVYPLVECEFEGRLTLKCPQKTQEYLRYMFGRGYMTPKKQHHTL